MNKLDDKKLTILLHEIKLDSPKADFSNRVMNSIQQEENSLEKIKSQKVFGKAFWIILILFMVLLTVVFVLSNAGLSRENQMIDQLPNINTDILSTIVQSLYQKIENIPLSTAGVFMAISILIFIDHFFSSFFSNRNLGV